MYPNTRSWLLLTIAILLMANTVSAQTESRPTVLQPNQPIERELAGGQSHTYLIQLNAGELLNLNVDQRGIDVVVILTGSDGQTLFEVDSPNGTIGPEPLIFVARTSGLQQIIVRSLARAAAPGRYAIKLEAPRIASAEEKIDSGAKLLAQALVNAATDDERAALLAKQQELVSVPLMRALFDHARTLRNERKFPQTLAIARLGSSLSQKLADQTGLGDFLFITGTVFQGQGDSTQALDFLQKSLALREPLNDKRRIGETFRVIGVVYATLLNDFGKARESFEKSLKAFQEAGDSANEIIALNNVGVANRDQGNLARAAEIFQQVLTRVEARGDKAATVTALLDLGFTNQLLGNMEPALDLRLKALALGEALGNKALIAQTLLNLGQISRIRSDYAKSLSYFERELKLRNEVGNKVGAANALNNIGWTNRFLANYEAALENYRQSFQLAEQLGNKALMGEARSLIGEVYRLQGNYAMALDEFHASLKISEGLRNKRGIADNLHRIGTVKNRQADFEEALDYFRKALKLREELGARGPISDSLSSIGVVYYNLKKYEMATEYFQKTLDMEGKGLTRRGAAIARGNLAIIWHDQKNYVRAQELFLNNLELGEEIGDRELIAYSLADLAENYRLQGNLPEALKAADRASSIARELKYGELLLQLRTTAGRSYQALNRNDEARQAFEEAVISAESQRLNIAGHESRSSYFATTTQVFELYTDFLMQMHKQRPAAGHDAEAFDLSERARARSLLEALGESRANIRQGVDSALLKRESSLSQKLNSVAERQMQMLAGKHTKEQADEMGKELAELTRDFQDVQALITRQSPRYAALTQPAPLSMQQVQREVLDPDTMLLAYVLGEERSYLWAMTGTSMNSYELPKRADIEDSVRQIIALLSDGKAWTMSAAISSDFKELARTLGPTLLPPSLFSQSKAKRLVVVGDGPLQYLPFGMLPSPKPGTHLAQAVTPLIADYEIVTLPSASTIKVLRQETAKRASGAKSVAVLADPVFEASDQRVAASLARPNPTGDGTTVSLRDAAAPAVTESRALLERALTIQTVSSADGSKREVLRLTRLPFTRFEAEGILAAASPNESLKATDFRANRATATSPELAQYRYVHFATHGILNSEHPELSGIVLSLVDEQGKPVDGFLRLHEIYNLNLPADLVVLSACQTGLGKEIKGEGLVGLTRGFMYAGTPRVVASLWKVDDAATAELMKRFYRGMLKDKLRPAAALRAAKVEMWKQKRWNAPFYWAAFELQGEWR